MILYKEHKRLVHLEMRTKQIFNSWICFPKTMHVKDAWVMELGHVITRNM